MDLTIGSRLKHAFNAFMNRDPTDGYREVGPGYSYRPDRPRLSRGNERSIVTSIFNRVALDVAGLDIVHCKVDEDGRFISHMDSTLNTCLTLEANLDQTGRAFIQDVVMSMLDEGCVAIVPVDTDIDPANSSSYDILSMRTGKVIEWYPKYVKVRVYNSNTGIKEDIMIAKNKVAIIENPLFAVVNEPNSTLQRLMRKLALLDVVDEQSSAGKLDMIIQLPYTIKSQARRTQAEARRKDIEMQLTNTKYGIAYVDATEKITQLNRPLENNLMKQIEYLTSMLYSQLGITQGILDGTADEQTLLNYHSRTIEPIVSAIVDEMTRKFLTKTARTQKQTIAFFRDPFKLVPINNIADIADKFTRNEILTSNEIRQILGIRPASDPKADQLINSNLNHPDEGNNQNAVSNNNEDNEVTNESSATSEQYDKAISEIDDLDAQIAELENELPSNNLKHYASPYYDPVKAHEYYIKNRELKGRTSTAKLNDEGRAAAKYVKTQLTAERKSKVDDHQTKTQSQIDARKEKLLADIETHKNQTSKSIESLRKQLSSMSMKDWDTHGERIQSEIAKLKEDNANARAALQSEFLVDRDKLCDDHKTERARLKEEYDEKYVSELDKIRSNSKFLKKNSKN